MDDLIMNQDVERQPGRIADKKRGEKKKDKNKLARSENDMKKTVKSGTLKITKAGTASDSSSSDYEGAAIRETEEKATNIGKDKESRRYKSAHKAKKIQHNPPMQQSKHIILKDNVIETPATSLEFDKKRSAGH